MRGRHCCVKDCGSSSHDHRGRKLLNGLSFYCFPAWRTNEGGLIRELTRRRRAAWVAAVGRSDVTFDHVPSSVRVCSRHFLSGKPAYEMLDSDPDWVPSLHLGHDDETSGTTEVRPGSRKPEPPTWKNVKSKLLEGRANDQNLRPAGERVDSVFRDFFRSALESSLEASIQSRSQNQSPPTEFVVELNFGLPHLEQEPKLLSSKNFSSCGNCSRLLRRIQDLEHQLFRIASKRAIPAEMEAPVRLDLNHQSSEEPKEDESGALRGLGRFVDPDSETASISPDPVPSGQVCQCSGLILASGRSGLKCSRSSITHRTAASCGDMCVRQTLSSSTRV